MRKFILVAALLPISVFAQDVQVVSISPRMNTIQQKKCENVIVQSHHTHQDNSMTGIIIGSVAGGIIGNQVGGGNGKTAATALGAVVGAMTGNTLGGQSGRTPQTQQVCSYVATQVYSGKTLIISFEGRHYIIETP